MSERFMANDEKKISGYPQDVILRLVAEIKADPQSYGLSPGYRFPDPDPVTNFPYGIEKRDTERGRGEIEYHGRLQEQEAESEEESQEESQEEAADAAAGFPAGASDSPTQNGGQVD